MSVVLSPPAVSAAAQVASEPHVLKSAPCARLARWRRATVAAVLAVYLASVGANWLPTPDSALYLMLAENLIAGHGYTLWGEWHTHAPPGFSLLLAGLMRVGCGQIWALNLAMLLTALAALACIHAVLGSMASARLALASIAVVAFSYEMHLGSIKILSDVPCMLLVWLGVWCYAAGIRGRTRWLELGTLALLAASLVRVAALPLAFGAALGLLLQTGRPRGARIWCNVLVLPAIGVALAVAGCAYYLANAGGAPTGYGVSVTRVLNQSAWTWLTAPLNHFVATGEAVGRIFTSQPINRWAALALLWPPLLIGAGVHWRSGRRLGVCMLVCYFGVLVVRPLFARYLLLVAPLLVLYYLEGVAWLVARRSAWREAAPRAAVACAVLFVVANAPKTARNVYWLRNPEASRDLGELKQLDATAAFLKARMTPDDRFISNDDQRQLAYLSGTPSLPKSGGRKGTIRASERFLRSWLDQGATIVVNRTDKSPQTAERLDRACRRAKLQLVYESDRHRVYAIRKPPQPRPKETVDTTSKHVSSQIL